MMGGCGHRIEIFNVEMRNMNCMVHVHDWQNGDEVRRDDIQIMSISVSVIHGDI